jgi:hypothetical protein
MRIPALLFSLVALSPFAVAAPEAFEVGPDRKSELPGGREADGIIGDFILRNDKIEAVISGNLPLRRANMSTFYGESGITPGCVFDLTLRGENNDQLTYFGPAQQQGSVSWVRVLKDGKGGEAVVECVATSPGRDGIARRHEYRLRNGWQGLSVTTTITNEGAKPRNVLLGDKWTNFVRTGNALFTNEPVMWAESVDPADRCGYAVGFTWDKAGVAAKPMQELAPGASLTFTRFLAVGRSPAEAVGVIENMRSEAGMVAGIVKDAAGAPVSGAQLILRQKNPPQTSATPAASAPTAFARAALRAAAIGYTDAQGRFAYSFPPGSYTITFTDLGRANVEKEVTINAGAITTLELTMAVASAVQFDIKDDAGVSIPCKAQFLALEGTDPVNLGPDQRAHGCRDQYHSERGNFRVQLPPGGYRVVVTRGIEYSHLSREVMLKAGETFAFSGTLKHLVDTRGWVSADYHNHSTQSGDNICGTDDRVINLAAEGVEFAPTTEHNRLYDWRPHIDRLGLANFVQTVPGMELTGSAAHFNSFPFKPEPHTQDNGAPVWNKDPRIAAITLRDWQGAEPDRWVQINHPDMVANFIDADGDGRADGGFSGLATLIDGVETQNYSASELLDGRPFRIGRDPKTGKESVSYIREFIWLQLLNRGHRYAAMAVCDAHTVWGNGVGGWRMYMPSASDEPAKIDWRENSRAAKAGRSYLTSGPFLQVTTDDGTGPGGTARAINGGVTLHVRVQCTDWLDIDRVQVLVNGRAWPELNFTRAKTPAKFKDGVVKFDESIAVPLSEDAHIIVVACSEHGDLHIGYGTSAQSKVRPFAYHNPIFVDVDGHGFTPNGDTLGWPLPTKKLSVDEAKAMLKARGFDASAPQPETSL